jgi:hypothetical protein
MLITVSEQAFPKLMTHKDAAGRAIRISVNSALLVQVSDITEHLLLVLTLQDKNVRCNKHSLRTAQ